MAEATIDELQIEISTTSGSAADNLEKLAQKLEHLNAVVQPLTANSGLEKAAKQLDKLSAVSQRISGLSGFEKIGQAVDNLKKIEQLNNIRDISPFIRNLNKIPQIVTAISQMPSIDPTKFQQLADALKPLETISAGNINGLMNSLKKLPQISQSLSAVDFSAFSRQIQQIAQSIEPLARQAQSAGAGLQAIAQIMRATGQQAQQSSGGVSHFNTAIGNIKVKTLAAVAALRRLFSALKNAVTASAAYVENLNLFRVTMGESADEALRFAESVNAALGVDTSDWIRYQGIFQSIGKGFGVASSQADTMSKNLTQLAYDISSFYNISVDTAAMKLQSAMSGQVMPMRELGFAIEETTLKQVAYNHGVTQSVETMTQAQKAQLRYVAMMEQAGNIGVLGDMARTIDTASNGMRVLEARIHQFSRAVGNMLMPMLSAVLPYATAFVQVLTEGAQRIADFFGFELPKIDFSGASVSTGYDDITSSIDNATEASEKFKGSLASIDQLNIIGSETENKTAAGNQFDLGIELPEYDFLQDVESKTKQIADDIKNWFKEALPWIEAVGAGIGAVFVTSKVKDFLGFLGQVKDVFATLGNAVGGKFGTAVKTFSGIAGGLAAGAASGTLFYNSIKNLITGTGDLTNNFNLLKAGVGIAGIAISAFIALGNPVGAVITGVVAGIGAIAGAIVGINEKQREMNRQISESIMYADNGGISIQGLADGFSGYFDTITSHYDDIIANTTAFENNQSKISTAAGEIHNLTQKYGALGEAMTSEDAQALSDNIKTIGDSIKNNLGTATQDIVDTLKTKFSDFAKQLGLDIDDIVGKFYLLQSMGNTALADLQKHAQELAIEISQSETIDPAKLQELDETVKKMSGTTTATAESVGFERALKEMDFSAIKFDDADSVKQAIDEIDNKAKEASKTINDAWNGQLLELQNTKEQYISLGVNVDFDKQFGPGAFDKLFGDAEEILNAGYQAELDKIALGKNIFLAMAQQQFDSNKQDAFKSTPYTWAEYDHADWNSYWDLGLTRTDEDFQRYLDIEHQKTIDDQFSPIQEVIDNAAKGVDLSQYYDVGKYIIEGMGNGAIAGQADFNNILTTIANGGLDALRKAFEEHSPSKKTEKIADYLMQGLKLGVTENENVVFSALDYVAIQSIMRLSKLKENISAFNLKEVDSNSIITDFSFKAPTVSPVTFEQQTGTAREAYEQAGQANTPTNSDVMATIELHSYIELDGDIVAEKVETRRVDMQKRMNGR